MLETKISHLYWDKNVYNESAVKLLQTASTNHYYHIVTKYDHVTTLKEVAFYPTTPKSYIYRSNSHFRYL